MTFDELNISKQLLNALSDLGYVNPTPIQREAFPIIMSGRDVVGVAQTGTGKTFAYLLPLLRSLKYSKENDPRILILVPTRELVIQVVKEVEKLTKYMSVRVGGVYGGTNIKTHRQLVYDGLEVLVATPGRLLDLVYSRTLNTKSIKKLVIDEVDEMLNLGFRTQLTNILDLLHKKRQNILFSATLSQEVEHLIDTFFEGPRKIEIVPHGTPLDQIIQIGYDVPNFYTKANFLSYLLRNNADFEKVLVFISTKKLADFLFETMAPQFANQIDVIHSNKSQNYRVKVVDKFHEGVCRVLIATDIIARGIDVQDVSHVVNFDIPLEPINYIHRIGRTGRADKKGVALSFISELERENQANIEILMDKKIPVETLPADVEIDKRLIDEELINPADKNYLKAHKLKDSGGAYHEKKEKNQKVNLGGPYKKKLKLKKNRRLQKRSGKKK